MDDLRSAILAALAAALVWMTLLQGQGPGPQERPPDATRSRFPETLENYD